jgi:uncharacterized protein YjbI with pentapeptide repeats
MDREPLDLDGSSFTGERFVGLELDRPQLVGCTFDGCDLSGVSATDFAARRLRLVDTRLRHCAFGGGIVQDTTVEGCATESLAARFATLQRVVISDCDLAGADFYGTTFDRVVFERCNLTRARFDGITVKDLTFRQCALAGVTGALALRGARIDADDLAALAPSLAREAGIVIAET